MRWVDGIGGVLVVRRWWSMREVSERSQLIEWFDLTGRYELRYEGVFHVKVKELKKVS